MRKNQRLTKDQVHEEYDCVVACGKREFSNVRRGDYSASWGYQGVVNPHGTHINTSH